MNAYQHEINKLNAQLATMTDGDESTDSALSKNGR